MSTVTITQLYELFVPKLGKEAAEGLATYLETKPKIELENSIKHLATKEDLAKLEGTLMSRMGESKAETIRWMFIFWIGQVLAICGFMLLFIKK
jgi:hypothetical protein